MAMRWYVVHAYAQFENSVAKALKERIARNNLQEQFGEILVPTEEVVEIRDGQKRTTERKFYPGYVYVNMDMNEDTWHLVKSTPKVLGFIGGTAEKPAPIPEKQMPEWARVASQAHRRATKKKRAKLRQRGLSAPGKTSEALAAHDYSKGNQSTATRPLY